MTDNNSEIIENGPVESSEPETEESEPVSVEESAASESQVIEVTVTSEEKPFMTTSFDDYSVSEGLLLCILLGLFIHALFRIIRRGFSWLL